jgi:hypothetical protein
MARLILLITSAVYATIIMFVNRNYLSLYLPHFGFVDSGWSADTVMVVAAIVAVVAMFVPLAISTVSSMFLITMYVFVIIPSVAITLSSLDKTGMYPLVVITLAASFIIPCILARVFGEASETEANEKDMSTEQAGSFSGNVDALIIWLSIISAVVLIIRYGDVISFVGVEGTYEQRALGASRTAFDGYLHTYFLMVFSPYLLARGLVFSTSIYRFVWIGTGIAGFLLMYGINAQKVALALPAVLVAFYVVDRLRLNLLRTTSFMVSSAAVLALSALAFSLSEGTNGPVDAIILHRAIGAGAITLPQYFDLFAEKGFTWWTHVKGVSLVIPEPVGWALDPNWPGLGYMVGDHVYGDPLHNVNANFFVSDGAAAGGPIGMILIGTVFGLWLIMIDRLSTGQSRTLILLLLLPLALTLTNGPLFTTMLSFGGIFWTILLFVWRQKRVADVLGEPNMPAPIRPLIEKSS